ncbi:MAG: hypothetical protein AAF492_21550, partial [Verrucomicrobiota bacterium]
HRVEDDRRTYRIRNRLRPGWYAFRLWGRILETIEAIDPEPERWNLKTHSGYCHGNRFFGHAVQKRLFDLPRDEELPLFVPITVAEWFDGHFLYLHQEFETEVEIQVREAFEDEKSIEGVKGVVPPLAQIFMLASTQRALARERAERERMEAQRIRWESSLEGRIVFALSHTGAELISWRNRGTGQAVVRYRLNRQRYECVIDTQTLRLLDAGICLDGHDRELSLSSIPSAVREAIDTGQLHVYRRG